MKPPLTEDSLRRTLEGMGYGWDQLQLAMGHALGLDAGSREEAEVIVGGSWPSIIIGSRRYSCALCERHVSLSPSGQSLVAERGIPVYCLRCARKEKA